MKNRKYPLWIGSVETWDAGYILDKKGPRMFVYRPDYPGCSRTGFALRSHVSWWLATGRKHRSGYLIHHEDENTLNDRFDNLKELTFAQHTSHHKKGPISTVACAHCGSPFQIPEYLISARIRSGRKNGPRFCNKDCETAFRKGRPGNKRLLTEEQVRRIKERLRCGDAMTIIARDYRVAVNSIFNIKSGKAWSYVK